jgi:hypothetical protein
VLNRLDNTPDEAVALGEIQRAKLGGTNTAHGVSGEDTPLPTLTTSWGRKKEAFCIE